MSFLDTQFRFRSLLAAQIAGAALAFLFSAEFASAAQTGQLELIVVDKESGTQIPCRVHLVGPKNQPRRVDGTTFYHDHFAMPGPLTMKLPLGNYSFVMERGLEYLDRQGYFTINQFAEDSKTVDLTRFANLADEGWYSGDLDVRRPLNQIELLMQADDLHVAAVVSGKSSGEKPATAKKPASKEKSKDKEADKEKTTFVNFDSNRYYDASTLTIAEAGNEVVIHRLGDLTAKERPQGDRPFIEKIETIKKNNPKAWVDVTRPYWLDMPTLVALGLADSIQVANGNIGREKVNPSEGGGRARNKTRFPDPWGNAQYSQDIYFKLLECGLKIPLSAGSMSGEAPNPVGANRMYVYLQGGLDYERWWDAFQTGQVFVTNGPLMRLTVQGVPPGQTFLIPKGKTSEFEIGMTLSTRKKIDYLDVIQNGKIVVSIKFAEYAKSGKLPPLKCDDRGWFALRVVAEDPKTYPFALSAPYYVRTDEEPRISKSAAQYFVDWTEERIAQLSKEAEANKKTLEYQNRAKAFWQDLVKKSNAE